MTDQYNDGIEGIRDPEVLTSFQNRKYGLASAVRSLQIQHTVRTSENTQPQMDALERSYMKDPDVLDRMVDRLLGVIKED